MLSPKIKNRLLKQFHYACDDVNVVREHARRVKRWAAYLEEQCPIAEFPAEHTELDTADWLRPINMKALGYFGDDENLALIEVTELYKELLLAEDRFNAAADYLDNCRGVITELSTNPNPFFYTFIGNGDPLLTAFMNKARMSVADTILEWLSEQEEETAQTWAETVSNEYGGLAYLLSLYQRTPKYARLSKHGRVTEAVVTTWFENLFNTAALAVKAINVWHKTMQTIYDHELSEVVGKEDSELIPAHQTVCLRMDNGFFPSINIPAIVLKRIFPKVISCIETARSPFDSMFYVMGCRGTDPVNWIADIAVDVGDAVCIDLGDATAYMTTMVTPEMLVHYTKAEVVKLLRTEAESMLTDEIKEPGTREVFQGFIEQLNEEMTKLKSSAPEKPDIKMGYADRI